EQAGGWRHVVKHRFGHGILLASLRRSAMPATGHWHKRLAFHHQKACQAGGAEKLLKSMNCTSLADHGLAPSANNGSRHDENVICAGTMRSWIRMPVFTDVRPRRSRSASGGAHPPECRVKPLPELTAFLEGLPDPHILFDAQYRILAANAAYRRQFSPQRSVIGRHCYEVSHHFAVPCDHAGESCPLALSRQSG